MGRGRKNKYYTHVQPHLNEIEIWLQDMTEEQIARKLGIAMSTWCKYKNELKEFSEAVKRGNMELVVELKSILKQRAKGFSYEEKKVIVEGGVIVKEEIYIKRALPDVASINLLLKNYDKDNWANDPQLLELRKKELELKERQVW